MEPPAQNGAAEPNTPGLDEPNTRAPGSIVPTHGPPTAGSTVAILIGIIAAALVAWFVPMSAVLLVWPVLFFVPGWVVIRRVVPDLPVPGAIGAAIVTSVYGSAHLVNIVARVGGFGRGSIIVSAVLLALGALVVARLRHRRLPPLGRPSLAGMVAALRADLPAWIVAAATGLVVFAVLMNNGWAMTPDGWVSGGWNWSDFLVHVAIGSSIAAGNFPPEVPYFAGAPLTYHWFADFHGAITSTVAGVDLITVYFLTSGLFAAVLAMVIWALTTRLTDSRRVATIATILVCFGGGMGWIRLVGDLIAGTGTVVDLVSNTSYDNTWVDGWPWFKIASIFGTGFLPHRATTLGLPGLVTVVLLIVACLGRRPLGVLLAGILAALLAPFQFFAFPATYLIVFLYVVTSGEWRGRTVWRDAVLFLAPVILATPFIASAVIQQQDIGAFRFVPGWSEARFGDGPVAVAFFYLTNLGIPFVLAVISGLTGRRLPGRWFLVAWMAALFVVPNVIVVSAVQFDMNKYFQIMWIAVAMLAAWLIRRWPRPLIATILVLSALSPALIAVWHVRSDPVALGLGQEKAARWIAVNTPERTVFATDARINSPVDLAGRLRITTFGPYVANLGYDPAPREADTTAIYCDGPVVAAERMAVYGATYVLSSGGIPCNGAPRTDFSTSPLFETVYDLDGVTIWRLAGTWPGPGPVRTGGSSRAGVRRAPVRGGGSSRAGVRRAPCGPSPPGYSQQSYPLDKEARIGVQPARTTLGQRRAGRGIGRSGADVADRSQRLGLPGIPTGTSDGITPRLDGVGRPDEDLWHFRSMPIGATMVTNYRPRPSALAWMPGTRSPQAPLSSGDAAA